MADNTLTQQDINKANQYIASLGPNKLDEKRNIWEIYKKGGTEYINFIKQLVSKIN